MDGRVGTAVLQGLGLGGVLVVAGVWARLVHRRELPHLGLGASAGVLAVLSFRMAGLPLPVRLLAIAAAGALLGAVLSVIDARARRARTGVAGFDLSGDVAILAVLLAAAALARPALSVALPFGPLGAWPTPAGSVAAVVIGSAGAVLLAMAMLPLHGRAARWAAAGGLLGVTVMLAAGLGMPDGLALSGVAGIPDTAGLALRAFAVGLAARRGVADAVAAGIGLGLLESMVVVVVPLPGVGLVVPVLAVAAGLLLHLRPVAWLGGAA